MQTFRSDACIWKRQYGGEGARRRGRWRHSIGALWLAVISWPRDLTLRNRCHAAVNQFREARLSIILVRDVWSRGYGDYDSRQG